MKFNKILAAAVLGGAVSLPMAASAVEIDGIVFEAGSIYELGQVWEAEKLDGCVVSATSNCNGLIDLVGEELIGVGVIKNIFRADDSLLWSQGDNGRELTVYFDSYIAELIDVAFNPISGAGRADIYFSGGNIQLYSSTYTAGDDFAPTTTQAGGIARATEGNLWLELTGAPLINLSLGPNGGQPITLISSAVGIDPSNPLASGSVSGTGRLDVVASAGTEADDYLDTNTFACISSPQFGNCPYASDKGFESIGGLQPDGSTEWVFSGNLTVRDVAAIPEPGTLALLGAGLIGMAARRRKTA